MFFVFFSIYSFLILFPRFLNLGSMNIYKFFLFERACRDAEHHRVLFFYYSLSLLCKTSIYLTGHPFLAPFFESFVLCWPFSAKKIKDLKKGLCGALHLAMLFLTKKNIYMLNGPERRNLGNEMSYF